MNKGTTALGMKGDKGLPTNYNGMLDCGYKMMKHEGPVSFLRGFSG